MGVILIAAVTLGGLDNGPIALEDLLQGLRDAEQTVDNFSFTARIEVVFRPPRVGKSFAYPVVADYIVDHDGRVRYDELGYVLSMTREGGKTTEERIRAVYDGSVNKRVEGNHQQFQFGFVDGFRHPKWELDPGKFLWQLDGRPIVESLTERKAFVQGETQWDGRTVTVVETTPTENDGKEWKTRLFVNPARSFAIVRRAKYYRPLPDGEWFEFAFIESRDYVEVIPGIWMPTTVVDQFISTAEDGSNELRWRISAQLDNWVVNAVLPPDTFAFSFPPGIFVNDHVKGTGYQTAAITDGMIDQHVGEAQRLREQLSQMPSGEEILHEVEIGQSRGLGLWWALMLVGLLIVLAGILFLRQRVSKLPRQKTG